MSSSDLPLVAQTLPVALGVFEAVLEKERLVARGVWRCLRVVVHQLLAHSETLLSSTYSELL